MLSLDEYISQKIYKGGIDVFNSEVRVENMGKCIKFVVEYFEEYVNPEKVSLETQKRKLKAEKYRKQLSYCSIDVVDWVVDVYVKYGKKMDMRVRHILKKDIKNLLCYQDDDFEKMTDDFLDKYFEELPYTINKRDLLIKLFKAMFKREHGSHYEDIFNLGSKINNWLRETFNTHNIKITTFAGRYLNDLFDKTHEYKYLKEKGKVCEIKFYNYKRTDNLFFIDDLYEEIKDRPFIVDRKLELEILFMYIWLNSIVGDDDNYWEEYISSPEISAIVNN